MRFDIRLDTAEGAGMLLNIEAVYENGFLKPTSPLPLREHEVVTVSIQMKDTAASAVLQSAGLLRWTGDPEVLRKMAEEDEFGVLESP